MWIAAEPLPRRPVHCHSPRFGKWNDQWPSSKKRLPIRGQKQEQMMKLSSMQIKQTLDQVDAEVLPDDHPAIAQLKNLFGDHTFFLDSKGLNVLEQIEEPGQQTRSGEIISLADWSDASLTKLSAHEPEPTGTIILLKASQN
jgi:hypothetical protein